MATARKTGKTGTSKSLDVVVRAPAPKQKPLTSYERLEAEGIDAICDKIENGSSLRALSVALCVPLSSLNKWIDVDQARREQYAHAREARADAVFDELDDVSDQAVHAENAVQVAGLRLKADTMKWKLARMNAKKYGDKQTIDLKAEVVTMTDEQRRERLAELQSKLGLLKK